ncbi:MAG TPA: aminotransferase class III-fold pyridoxal phosphate-dependent enzyme [Candidatus Dormibacteraeota bacterium]|nr:aminotransferase class III-fold pyridoxal phosphate-dependent enzyme [Candidatus Dormibacteraeota bacterium]
MSGTSQRKAAEDPPLLKGNFGKAGWRSPRPRAENGMMSKMHPLAALDLEYVWHPFTQMRDWLRAEPIVLVEGDGAVLRDVKGRSYLDANSSIWTNLHGHNHPKINAALRGQLKKVAHTSALGLASGPASLLAANLVGLANAKLPSSRMIAQDASAITKCFFSDDGSTAMEVALKLAYEFARRSGSSRRPKFLSLKGAYHGDTVGAVSLGHIDLFHAAWSGLLFKTDKVTAPYCYRCPYNRAKPERADARDYRECEWECLRGLEQKFEGQKKKGESYAAFVFEPLIQGAAGMIPQPAGWLKQATDMAGSFGAQLIADEVMTGFGRTGILPVSDRPSKGRRSVNTKKADWQNACPTLFACHKENVRPDFIAIAKGLTGGYLPMAATLTTQPVFDAFLGEYHEFRTFFHGHSYSGNQLGASAALASLQILRGGASVRARKDLERALADELKSLWALPVVGDIRQVGLIAGIELVRNWKTREPFELKEQAGIRVCQAMAHRGVLTRPIGNVIVLMPPYCTTRAQLRKIVTALREALEQSLMNK